MGDLRGRQVALELSLSPQQSHLHPTLKMVTPSFHAYVQSGLIDNLKLEGATS